MNKYVKIKSPHIGVYSNWFLEYNDSFSLLDWAKFNDKMQTRLIQDRFLTCINKVHGKVEDRSNWLVLNALKAIDYSSLYKKYGKLYVRENGTYMTIGDGYEIVEEIYCNHFPVTDGADIVICENDRSSESFWMNYLMERFPNKSIKTINYFSSRTDEEVKEYFKGAEFITFSTTFSDYEWFKKAIRNKNEKQKLIGYTHIPEKWEGAKKIYKNIEIAKLQIEI